MAEEEQKVVKRKAPVRFLLTAFFFAILGAVVAGGGVYNLARKYPDVLGLSTVITQEEVDKKLLTAVGNIMDIPKDETPIITTVSENETAPPESYFKNAHAGDKVIAYTNSKRVILYRPSENKIIDVGFIASAPIASPTATPVPKPMSVFMLNGTDTVGATKNIEAKLGEIDKSVAVVGRGVASKTDYLDSIVIDLSGNQGEQVKRIASELGISAATLPEGETKPDNTDFLIIVGKNSVTATPSATLAP